MKISKSSLSSLISFPRSSVGMQIIQVTDPEKNGDALQSSPRNRLSEN